MGDTSGSADSKTMAPREYRCLCPLYRFGMSSDRLEIAPGLSIVRATQEDAASVSAVLGPAAPFASYSFAIEAVVGQEPSQGGGTARGMSQALTVARTLVDALVTAMRLLQPGFFSIVFVVALNPVEGSQGRPGMAGGRVTVPTIRGRSYHLMAASAPRLKEMLRRLQHPNVTESKKLLLAIRRLLASYDHVQDSDRLIDYVIALEALLLESSDELKYRMALRGAWLLGTDGVSRRDANMLLRKAYDRRSRIAHGTVGKKEKKTIPVVYHDGTVSYLMGDLVEDVEQALRVILCRLIAIAPTRSLGDILEDLDRAALTGELNGVAAGSELWHPAIDLQRTQ